jgi:hypothetical protein
MSQWLRQVSSLLLHGESACSLQFSLTREEGSGDAPREKQYQLFPDI